MRKKTLKNLAVLAASLLLASLLGACAKQGAQSMLSESDLKHHNYVLESVDGRPFSSEFNTPNLSFNQDFSISGKVCNNFRGPAQLSDNVLTVEHMASTLMLCPDQQLNELENDFAQMLRAGARISLEGNRLTLSQGDRVLVYRLRDYVN